MAMYSLKTVVLLLFTGIINVFFSTDCEEITYYLVRLIISEKLFALYFEDGV